MNLIGLLEYEWDNPEARLKPVNQAKWTEVSVIDAVLRQLRTVSPSEVACKRALENLLRVLDNS